MKISRKLAGLWLVAGVAALLGGEAHAGQEAVIQSKIRADQMLKQGQIGPAIQLYEGVLAEDRRFANAYYNLATAYYLEGNLTKAAENLESLLRLHPGDAEARYNLACLKIRLGDFAGARGDFLKAEAVPSPPLICQKIKEALLFMKGLENQGPEDRRLLAYLITGSEKTLLAS